MPETKKLICPDCGHELEIPIDLEEFSCLYCGARTTVAHAEARNASANKEYETLRAELKEALPKAVTRYPNHFRKIDKKHYVDTFTDYELENGETVDKIEVCTRLRANDISACVKELCTDLLDALADHMSADPRWKKKHKRSELMFEVKVVLALFLTPLIRKRKVTCAEEFCTELNRLWLERWKEERWLPGDYDVIVAGFKRRKLCYITTATCQFEGKPDHCDELTAFRAFRDNWLTANGDAALIDRYYELAPSLVTCMDYCDDAERCYTEIRERWLEPCYQALQEHREADCREIYIDMVQTLEQRYLQ